MTKRFSQWLAQRWTRPGIKELDRAYLGTFSTPEGRVVLQHLLNEVYCQICPTHDPIDLATHNGRRSVVQEILENIERGEHPPQPLTEESVYATRS